MFFLKIKTIKLIIVAIFFFCILNYIVLPWGFQQLFPLKYWDEIKYFSDKFSLDPFLIAAIIKVESEFKPHAMSKRGAKGLMQLMPETAKWIASQNGMEYKEEFLFKPEYNIHFGCWYLNSLRNQFDGSLPLILAAYNGGRGNVKKWLQKKEWDGKFKNLNDIPFKETRQFVKKVNYNYKIYKWFYKEGKKRFFLRNNEILE